MTRLPGYAETLRANGFVPSGALEVSELALVPRDATWASVGKVSFAGMFDFLVELATDALAQRGLPSYGELARGALSTVSVGRMLGADWVVESRGDASLAVQLTMLCGWGTSNGLLLALPMFAAVGASKEAVPKAATPF